MFSEHMQKAMDAKGWRPVRLASELADRDMRVAVNTVEGWLRGDFRPQLAKAIVIAEVLEFRLEDTNQPVGAEGPKE